MDIKKNLKDLKGLQQLKHEYKRVSDNKNMGLRVSMIKKRKKKIRALRAR